MRSALRHRDVTYRELSSRLRSVWSLMPSDSFWSLRDPLLLDEPLRPDDPPDDDARMPLSELESESLLPPLRCEPDEELWLSRCEEDWELWLSRCEPDEALWPSRGDPDDAFWLPPWLLPCEPPCCEPDDDAPLLPPCEPDEAPCPPRCEPDVALCPEPDCPSPCDELLRSRFELLDEPLIPPLLLFERDPEPVFELFF